LAIFDVSMTAGATGFSGFALVSSAICFSGASSGDFISRVCHSEHSRGCNTADEVGEARLSISRYPLKIRDVSTSLDMTGMAFERLSLLIKSCPTARMLLQNFAGSKFHFSSGQPFQFLDGSLYSEVFRESQGPAAKGRKTGPQNHSVIRILWRIDDSFFHATSGLIHREQNEPMSQLLFIEP
jgi:hypothetical protein